MAAGLVFSTGAGLAGPEMSDGPLSPPKDPFAFSVIDVDFLTSNPTGGLKSGQWGNTSQLIFGVDGDMSELLGWTGGAVHIRESFFGFRRNGSYNPTKSSDHFWVQDIGSTLGGTPLPNFIPRTTLTDLTIEQHIGSHFMVQAGRMNPLNYFDTPDNCGTLYSWQNPIFIYDANTLPSPYATWGGVASFIFSKDDRLQVGAYEDNSSENLTEGFDWSLKDSIGAFLVTEYVHKEGFDETRYPMTIRLGLLHDTSLFTDAETGHNQRGSTAIFWRTANTVWRTGEIAAAPSQYLSLFTYGGASFDTAQPYRFFMESGVNAHGFMGMPANDFVGVKLAYLRINSNQLQSERLARLEAGGRDFLSSHNQYRFEVNLHYELWNHVFAEPSLEYVWNPNARFTEGKTTAMVPKDGLILSFSMLAHFSTM